MNSRMGVVISEPRTSSSRGRYRRAVDLEDLIIALTTTYRGITIADIEDRYDVSRRTAERMRDAIGDRFELVQVSGDDDRRKRWRIEGGRSSALIRWQPEEAAALEKAAEAMSQTEEASLAQLLRRVASKIRTAV